MHFYINNLIQMNKIIQPQLLRITNGFISIVVYLFLQFSDKPAMEVYVY